MTKKKNAYRKEWKPFVYGQIYFVNTEVDWSDDIATELDFRPYFVTQITQVKQKGQKGLFWLKNQKFS